VGKDHLLRWLELKNARGNFTIEYHNQNPRLLGMPNSSIDHISRIENWSVVTDSIPSSASIELSFVDPNSGGVTNLTDLCVAGLADSIWKNTGNTTVTGTAGFRGSVVSNLINPLGQVNYFTLGSSSSADNPLPLGILSFKAVRRNNNVYLSWEISAGFEASDFIIERSDNNNHFQSIAKIVSSNEQLYSYMDTFNGRVQYYRITATGNTGEHLSSKLVRVTEGQHPLFEVKLYPTIAKDFITLSLTSPDSFNARFLIIDLQGRTARVVTARLVPGKNQFNISLLGLGAGIYRIFELSWLFQIPISPFIKQ
jgi:hypothetical protein